MSVVRAAGGVVVRDREILLVHRPKYDDWTFPKGKAAEGESDEDCALREVAEETGLHCALIHEIGATEYVDSKGRDKRVRWWLMVPLEGDFAANQEVDAIRWLRRHEAAGLLSYQRDVALLERMRCA